MKTTNTTIIKRKSDIDNLLNEMPRGSSISVPSTFGGYGKGVYGFKKIDDNNFSNYNSGQNWSDRESSNVDRQFVIDTIWENRKDFNQHLRDFDYSLHGTIYSYH